MKQSTNQQSNCAIETIPSTYQSFLKRKLYRKKRNLQTTPNHQQQQQEESSFLADNNQLNTSLNNLDNLANQLNERNDQNEQNDDNPIVLTLLGHNPIIFARRRVKQTIRQHS